MLVLVDELDEVERLAALELDAFDLFGVEQDVMALRHLVALDDLVAVDRPDAGHDLLIFDPLAGRLVDLVELDLRRRSWSPDTARPESTPGRAGFALAISDAQPYESLLSRGRFNSLRRRVVPCRLPSMIVPSCDISATGRDDRRSPSRKSRLCAPASSAARTCSGVEIPKPNTGGGAPARFRRSMRPRIELPAGVGAGDPGAADAIGVGLRQLAIRASARRAYWRRRSAPARSRPAPFRATKRLRLERRHVGDQQAVGAGLRGIAHEAGPRDDDIGISQDAERDVRMARAKPRDQRRSNRRPGRPAASARCAAAWITGPSATGSEKGMPTSIMSAPPSTTASSSSRAGFEVRIAEHQESAERALAARQPLEHRRIAAHSSSALRLGDVLVAAAGQTDEDGAVRLGLGELQRMSQRVGGFERAQDALALAPAP